MQRTSSISESTSISVRFLGVTILLTAVLAVLRALALDPERLALGWARVLPAVFIVPAFGLRGIPPQTRGVFALLLALVVTPAISISTVPGAIENQAWAVRIVAEVLAGLPVALAAAIPLWTATMVGGLADQARGQSGETSMPLTEGRATVFGHVYSLLAGSIFLLSGGASRTAAALVHARVHETPLLQAKDALLSGITAAVALGGPLIVTQIVFETASALVARAASPSQVQTLVAPFRSLAALLVSVAMFERMATLFGFFALQSL
jgi:type III secretory pathway component EscT